MASPPSPAFASLPNPKKRPSISSTTSASAAKRRQLHPLRQMSFPASQLPANGLDSAATPSARSEAGSTFSATSSRVPGRGRGRPRKSHTLPHPSHDDTSTTGGGGGGKSRTAKSVVSTRSGNNAAGGNNNNAGGSDMDSHEEDDDDDDDVPEAELGADEAEREKEEEELRGARERRLAEAFDEKSKARWEVYRNVAVEKKTVRRIINAVMSQSANEKVIDAIRFTSKLYIGDVVERARDVQREWAEAYDETRQVEKKWRRRELERLRVKKEKGGMGEQEGILVERDIARLEKEVEMYIPNPHKGGLLPDHLREAVRRYRAAGEGSGAADQGTSHSLLGVPGNAAVRAGDGMTGRRLFR